MVSAAMSQSGRRQLLTFNLSLKCNWSARVYPSIKVQHAFDDWHGAGSYSFVGRHASARTYDELALPVHRRLLFAGEHTCKVGSIAVPRASFLHLPILSIPLTLPIILQDPSLVLASRSSAQPMMLPQLPLQLDARFMQRHGHFLTGDQHLQEHPDTVGGAMLTGMREAVRAIHLLRGDSSSGAEAELDAIPIEAPKKKRRKVGNG